jgi:predicted PurR-regulated permease PerM
MDFQSRQMKKTLFIITFAIVVFISLQNISSILSMLSIIWRIIFPFILGGAIAFILNIPMKATETRLHKLKKKKFYKYIRSFIRPCSLVAAILLVVIILGVVIFLVVPELARTIILLGKNIEQALPGMQTWVTETFNNNKDIVEMIDTFEVNWGTMLEGVGTFVKNGAGNFLASSMAVTISIFGAILNLIIAIVFACYFLLQKEKLSCQVQKIMFAFIPEEMVHKLLEIGHMSHRIFSGFITGQCIEALILGSMFFVAMILLRMPYALLVGVLIAFTALIPIVGAFIGCIVGAILIFMQNPMQAAIFIVLFLFFQQIEGNLIYPHVVGNSVGLPSIWVLFSVTIGGSIMGIVGMLIFIPIMSVLYVLLKQLVHRRLKERNIKVL